MEIDAAWWEMEQQRFEVLQDLEEIDISLKAQETVRGAPVRSWDSACPSALRLTLTPIMQCQACLVFTSSVSQYSQENNSSP
ncbi:uncharacterized [Tachysurus ichikawai]